MAKQSLKDMLDRGKTGGKIQKVSICEFVQIASPQSVHHVGCASEATYEAVDVLAPALERVQKPVCTGHARFLHGQGFWIFPQGDDEAQSLGLSDIK